MLRLGLSIKQNNHNYIREEHGYDCFDNVKIHHVSVDKCLLTFH